MSDTNRTTMEAAALEIARLSEDVEYLRQALEAERAARQEAESHLLSMEDRMIELEQAIREDCTTEFERRLEIEMARWRATMQVEMERGEEHWGRKIEVFERSMGVRLGDDGHSDDDDGEEEEGHNKENVLVEDASQECERLRRENEMLRRELAAMSPTKRMPLQERGSDASLAVRSRPMADNGSPRPVRTAARGGGGAGGGDGDGGNNLQLRLAKLRLSDDQAPARSSAGNVSPKKVRRLPAKRWNAVGEDDDLF
jgi:hypothetical protein